MKIIYKNGNKIEVIKLTQFGVVFIENKACFDDRNGKHYSINISDLIEISIF